MEEEKRYETPNGKILTETFLRNRFGGDFGKLVASGQFVETVEEIQSISTEDISMPRYIAPNGKEFTENELKDKFGNQWESVSVQFEKKNPIQTTQEEQVGDSMSEDIGLVSKEEKELEILNSGTPISEKDFYNEVGFKPDYIGLASDNSKRSQIAIDEVANYKDKWESSESGQLYIQQQKQRQEEIAAENILATQLEGAEGTKEAQDLLAEQEVAKQSEEKIRQDKVRLGLTEDEEFNKSLDVINKDLIAGQSSDVTPILNTTLGKYGFVAEDYGILGFDRVVIRNTFTGARSVVELDNFTGSEDETSASKLKDFIRDNAVPVGRDVEKEEETALDNALKAKSIRPVALVNADGSQSTVRMMSYEEDGKHYAAPTLFPKDPDNTTSKPIDWELLSPEDAIAEAKKRGEVFSFDSEEEAQDFAEGSWKDVSTVDLEAERFYTERGLDYNVAKAGFDMYEQARDERMFLEEMLEGEPRDRLESNLTKEEKELYGKFYVNGVLRTDASERIKEIEKTEDRLFKTYVDDQNLATAREDFDGYLAKKQRQAAGKSAEINRKAQLDYMKIDSEVINNFGIRAKDIVNYVPKNEYEASLKDVYINGLNTVSATENLAALKYDIAETYFSKKENKNIQDEYLDNWESVSTAWKDGLSRGLAMEQIVMISMGITDLDDEVDKKEAAEKIAQYLSEQSGKTSRVNARYFGQVSSKEGWNNFLRDPLEWMVGLAANSISQMLPYGAWLVPSAVATGVGTGTGIGAAVGSTAGGVGAIPGAIGGATTGFAYGVRTGFAATSFAMEYSNSVIEALENQGFNTLNPDEVAEGLMKQEVWDEANDRGVKRGLVIGAVDLLSAGLSGRVFKAGTFASTGTRAGVFALERAAFDPAMEALGEGLAQASVGDELDWKEIGAEAGGAGGNNVSNAAVNVYIDQRNRSNAGIADNLANNMDFMMNESASDTRINSWTDNMEKLGKIDSEQAQKIRENIGIRREVNELASVTGGPIGSLALRGNTLTTQKNVKTRLGRLIEARNKLGQTTNTREVFKGKIKEINAEIAQIAETGQVQSISTEQQAQYKKMLNEGVLTEKEYNRLLTEGVTEQVNLDLILGNPETERAKTGKYMWRGRQVTRDQFIKKLDKSKKLGKIMHRSTAVLYDPEVQKLLISKKDAIQKQETGRVSEDKQTGDIQAVERDLRTIQQTAEPTTTETTEVEEALTISTKPTTSNVQVEEGAIVEDVIGETTNEVKGQVITQPDGKFSVRQGEKVIESNVESKEDALKVLSDNIEVAPKVKVTKKTEVTEVRGDKVSTKTPVTISYNRNTEPAPKMGKEFGQDVEASGTYVTQKVSDFTPQGFETGDIQLKSPLVIDVTGDTQIEYKRTLSKQYGNKKGKRLSNALKKEGYDSIVTKNEDGTTGEIVLLNDINTYVTEEKQNLEQEVEDLQAFIKKQNPKFKLADTLTNEQRQKQLTEEATRLMKLQQEKISENSYTVEEVDIQTIPIVIDENTSLAKDLRRMGLSELIGKKINLIMADQLITNEEFMGGPFFSLNPAIRKHNIAWANLDEASVRKIAKGAVESDYTVVYNMNPDALSSNTAIRTQFLNEISKLDNDTQQVIFDQVIAQLKGKVYGVKGVDTQKVEDILAKSTTAKELFDNMDTLSLDTKAKIFKNIVPLDDKASETEIGKTLESKGITMQTLREPLTEDFVKNLPAGSMTMVLEIQDSNGNKVTNETIDDAIVSPEQQREEGIPEHPNYPFQLRGKPVALLRETTPFWNVIKGFKDTIEAKFSKIIRKNVAEKVDKKTGKVTPKTTRPFTAAEAISDTMYKASVTSTQAKKIMSPVARSYANFVNLLSKSFPNVEVITDQATFDNLLIQPDVVEVTTKTQRTGNKVYGAVYKGKLYLNPKAANTNTPIHEFGHIWNAVAKEFRPELYQKGLELIETDDTYISQIENSPEYKRVIKDMKKQGATDAEIREFILEEALATAIGDKGQSFADASVKADFKNWLNKLYNFVKSLVGLSKMSDEEVQNLSLDEFLQGVVVDLLSGEEVFAEAQSKQIGTQLQLMTGNSITDMPATTIVSTAREAGYSDAAIRIVLKEQGLNKADINEALVTHLDTGLFNDVAVIPEFGDVEGGMDEGRVLFDNVRTKLKAYTKPTRTRTYQRETEEQKTERATRLREANPTLFAMTDEEVLRRYPRVGVSTTITNPPKTKSQIRLKAIEILKAEPIFEAQPKQTQDALIVALDKTIDTRANVSVQREINAIKQRIKTRKEASDNLQSVKRAVREIIRKALPEASNITTSTVNKLNNIIAKATDATILKDMAAIEKQVNIVRQRVKNDVVKEIQTLVKKKSKARITESRKQKSTGISAEARAFMKASNDVLSRVIKNDVEGMLKIMNELADNESLINEAILKEIQGEKLTQQEERIVNLSYAFDNFSDIGNMSLEDTQSLLASLKEVNAEGIRRYKSRRKARVEQIKSINREGEIQMTKDFGEEILDKDGTPKDKNQLTRDRDKIHKMYADKDYAKWIKEYIKHYKWSTFSELMKSFKNNFKHLGTLTNNLDISGNFFTENIYNRLNRADEANMEGYFRTQNKLDEIVNSIYGIDKGMDQVRDIIYSGGTMTVMVKKINKDGSIGKTAEDWDGSVDQLMRIYSLYKNPVQRAKLEKQGFTQQVMTEVEAFLGPQLTGVSDKIVEFLSNEYYNEVNGVYRQVNDINLDYVENYFPTQTISTGTESLLSTGDFSRIFNAESAPALKTRTDVRSGVVLDADFAATLQTHIKTMERYKAYAMPVKIIQGIFDNSYTKTLLESMSLTGVVKNAINYAINPDSFRNPAQSMRIIDILQSKYTSFALALKVMQIPKQATSFINALENYRFRKGKSTLGLDTVMFMIDTAMLSANLLAEITVMGAEKVSGKHIGLKSRPLTEAMNMSSLFKRRVELGVKGDLMGLESGQPTFKDFESNQAMWAKLGRGGKRIAASPTVIGDIMGVMGYMVNYRRNIKNGMSNAQAKQEFNDYNATQQSRRATEKIPLQMNPNALTRTVTMFGSTLFLQINKVMQATTNLGRQTQEAIKTKDASKIKLQDIRSLYLNASIANVLFTGVANIFKLTSDDPKDRDAALARMRDALFGLNLIYQIPIFGEAAEQAISDWVYEDRKTISQGVNPVSSVYKKWKNGVKYDKADPILEGAKVLGELAAGVQVDPLVGLAETFTGGFDEKAMYDMMGVTYSYRPGSGQSKSKGKSTSTNSARKKDIQDIMDRLSD